MKRVVLITALASVGVACGAGASKTSGGGGSSALVTGDSCALHQDSTTCRADPQGCSWYANTRPCQSGQPCPAGWCYLAQQGDGGPSPDGGVSAAAGCACSGGGTDVCVEQIGGPPMPSSSPPSITCTPVPSGCGDADPCACLAQGSIERCWSSDQVTNLCICDNGIR